MIGEPKADLAFACRTRERRVTLRYGVNTAGGEGGVKEFSRFADSVVGVGGIKRDRRSNDPFVTSSAGDLDMSSLVSRISSSTTVESFEGEKFNLGISDCQT